MCLVFDGSSHLIEADGRTAAEVRKATEGIVKTKRGLLVDEKQWVGDGAAAELLTDCGFKRGSGAW